MGEKILTDMEAIRYKALAYKGVLSGKLRLSVVSTGKYVLPYYLKGFLQANPSVDLRVDVTNRSQVLRSLEENEVDFSLVSVLPGKLPVAEEVLLPNRWYLVAPGDYPLAPRRSLGKAAFAQLPLIFREEGSGTRLMMQDYFSREGVVPRFSFELASDEAVKQAVIAGLGLSILSLLTLKNELALKEVKIIPIKGLPLVSSWRLIWPQRKEPSFIARAYLDFVRREKEGIREAHFGWLENR